MPRLNLDGQELFSEPMEEGAKNADCVVIVTDHSSVDYSRLLECSQLIVDTRNRLKGFNSPKITRL